MAARETAKGCGYTIISEVGSGSYGTVFIARDENNELVAYKFLRDGNFGSQLMEIDVMSRISHPHVIHALKIITSEQCDTEGTAIVMPLLYKDLKACYKAELPPQRRILILYQLLRTLEFLHENNIKHGDIWPRNIMFEGGNLEGGEEIGNPFFIDFGEAKYTYNKDELAEEMVQFRDTILMLFGAGDEIRHKPGEDEFPKMPKEYQRICKRFFWKDFDEYSGEKLSDHPIFDEVRYVITGTTLETPIPNVQAFDHNNRINLIASLFIKMMLGENSVVNLFTAMELFHRMGGEYVGKTEEESMELAIVCVITSLSINFQYRSKPLIKRIGKVYPTITEQLVNTYMKKIVYYLNGILYVNKIYDACRNLRELKYCYKNILLSTDPTIYEQVDIPALQIMFENKYPRAKRGKYVMIGEFL